MDHVHGRAVTLITPDGAEYPEQLRVLDWSGEWGGGSQGEQTVQTIDVEVPTSRMPQPARGYIIEIEGNRFGFDDVLQRDTHGRHVCRFRRVVPREAVGNAYRGGRS